MAKESLQKQIVNKKKKKNSLTGFYSKDLILELAYDKYYIVFAY